MDRSDKSFYSRLKQRKKSSEVGRPFFCDLLISEKCNSRCKMCYFWKHALEDELTIEECKNVVASLKGWAEMPFEINLGGGEPLLKRGILELARYCVKQGLQPTISTNATLIDKEMAKRISDVGLHRLSLSLQGFNEDTHDFVTGTKGSYGRLMRALEYLKRYWRGGDLNIHTIILEQNIDQIMELVEWVNRDNIFTGISFQALAQPFRTNLVDRWYLESEHSFLWPKDSMKVSSIIDKLIRYKIAGYKILNPLPQLVIYKRYYKEPEAFARIHKCNFGDYIFNVNALGLVHLCCFMQPVGSIKKDDIKDIWYSEKAQQTRSMMYNCQKSCNNIVNCFFQEEGDEVQSEVQKILREMRHRSEDVAKDNLELSSKKTEEPSNHITSCDLLLTSSCMLRCKICYLWQRRKNPNEPEELGIEGWKQFIYSLQQFAVSEPIRLHFGGGEPFLKEGILDLVKFSTQKGFKTMVTSNGFLIDEEMACKISDSGLEHITLSLDGLNADVHDYLRGAKGSHYRVFKAIEYLYNLEKKPTIGINSIISNVNLDEILPLAHWAINDERISGIIFQAIVQPYETPMDEQWYSRATFSELWPNWPEDKDRFKYVIDQLIELKVNGQTRISNSVAQLKAFKEYFQDPHKFIQKMACPMDNSSLLVNWDGQVYSCGLLQPIGNIRSLTIEEILMSQLAEDRWDEMKSCRKNCNNKVNCFFKEKE